MPLSGADSPKSALIAPTPIFRRPARLSWYHFTVAGLEKSSTASS